MQRFLLAILISLFAQGVQAARLPILTYHDLVQGDSSDELAVAAVQFREQMDFLSQNGYQPISLQACRDAAKGRAKLPDKAVMITFDDGLASFSEIALPILERHRFPAVLSVTTGWQKGEAVPEVYRGRLLTPDQLRLISRNPSIEILSHSDHLHESLTADPQGSQAAAGISRRYQATSGYESEFEYRQRIRRDLRMSSERLASIVGRKPRGIAWPYGLHNPILDEEAAAEGLEAQLALDDQPADCLRYPYLSRVLLRRIRTLADFETALRLDKPPVPVRLVEIRLDDIAGAPPPEQDTRLRQLVERVRLLRVNLAIVHPFATDGNVAFFTNPGLPFRADILHRALHLLRATAAVRERLLALPAAMPPSDVLTELAGRHPYEGIVLIGAHNPDQVKALRTQFSRYQSGLRCGLEGTPPADECRDFQLVIASDKGPPSQREVSDSYYLVRSRKGEGTKEVVAQLREMRRRGLVHFGFSADGLLDDPESVRRLAIELAAFAPTGGRD